MSLIGRRALEPFYSEITDNVSLGSIPLASDVPVLLERGVRSVVNMCWEYSGPKELYSASDIVQLHLPTMDIWEPDITDTIRAVRFMQEFIKKNPQSRVFVHCKGGRGRAVTVALCFLIAEGLPEKEAFALIKSKRCVAAEAVLHSHVVHKFIELSAIPTN
eukprot:CAMPEP_0185039224 /NCGR_PEP_ID=MMETSP1103-20130426/35854_1 /TAXON_ID=36769 /ORGANISM="Paraphysomonas bandaiensis, Strain Caron Lab Isolate" /LENGTH=160 /DNA_ID=CAMNT_0027578027 /DNA_START=271 /DNA_END=753 /DNA_ORIENTATION=-